MGLGMLQKATMQGASLSLLLCNSQSYTIVKYVNTKDANIFPFADVLVLYSSKM